MKRKGAQVIADVLGLLVRGGQAWLEVEQGRQLCEREDEATSRGIAQLDADTQAFLARARADLSKAQDKTERLRIVLENLTRSL